MAYCLILGIYDRLERPTVCRPRTFSDCHRQGLSVRNRTLGICTCLPFIGLGYFAE
jgi:hypothetical protein